MNQAVAYFDDTNSMDLNHLTAAGKVTQKAYEQLVAMNRSPYPNNFNLCNIAKDSSSQIMEAPEYLQHDDCKLSEFNTNSITFPDVCEHSCDAFSILLSHKEYDGDNVCLTYDVQRLFDYGW